MPEKPVSIIDLIKQQIRKEESLPVLNPKATRVQAEALKAEPDFAVLTRLIRMDPTLTTQILKTANSPFYKGILSFVKEILSFYNEILSFTKTSFLL